MSNQNEKNKNINSKLETKELNQNNQNSKKCKSCFINKLNSEFNIFQSKKDKTKLYIQNICKTCIVSKEKSKSVKPPQKRKSGNKSDSNDPLNELMIYNLFND